MRPQTTFACARPLQQALHVLRTRFGHQVFRPGQQTVLRVLLENPVPRALAIFPTAAGKSLCYQIPAIMMHEAHVTLVVSPLLALVKDQMHAMQRLQVQAVALDSRLNAEEMRDALRSLKEEKVSVVFVAPERFRNERFLKVIANVKVGLVVIDEVHCVSEWGHAFRPDYLRLAKWIDRFGWERRLLLTATAGSIVEKDVCQRFGIPHENVTRLEAVRKELRIGVTRIVGGEQEKIDRLVKGIACVKGPVIVYVTLQKTAEQVAQMLTERGVPAVRHYHAGLPKEEREEIQEWFMNMKTQAVIVGTIAFGMGLDHDGVRAVFHYNIPRTLEGYVQEIGRAGRDGKEAYCEALVDVDDLKLLEAFVYAELPEKESVRKIVEQVLGDGNKYDIVEFGMGELGYKWDVKETCFKQIVVALELEEKVLEELTPFYATVECTMKKEGRELLQDVKKKVMQVLELCEFKRKKFYVDVIKVGNELNMEYGSVARILDDLVMEDRIEKTVAKRLMSRVKLLRDVTDIDTLTEKMYERLEKYRDNQLKQLERVIEFFAANECQSHFLQRYLGDTVAENEEGCGRCGYCENDGSNPAMEILEDKKRRVAKPLDEVRWDKILTDPKLPKDNALLLARFAAGISSPIISRKYRRIETYGSMADHDFHTLLKAAKRDCVDY